MIFITAKFQIKPEEADDWPAIVASVHQGDPRRAGLPVV